MNKNVYHRSLVAGLFLISLLCNLTGFAQQPVVKTIVDKRKIVIGEQIHYQVSTSMPDNTYRLTWFTIPDSLPHFQVVQRNKIDSLTPNGNINFSQDIIITSFDSGLQVIPPFAVGMETLQGDSTFNLFTDSIPVEVTYTPMDSVKTFHDIKSIIEIKKDWAWWWWAILGAAILLLIFWIRFLIKFLKKKPRPADIFTSKLSPYDEAIQSLNDLQKQPLLQQNEVKAYHTKLGDIFKRYLSRQTKVYKLNLTSDEILMELKEYDPPHEQLSLFANYLRMDNAVKFAKYIPPQVESEKSLEQTKEMITEIHKNFIKNQGSAI